MSYIWLFTKYARIFTLSIIWITTKPLHQWFNVITFEPFFLHQQLHFWRNKGQSVATHQTRGTQNPGFFSPGLNFKFRFLETLTFILKMPWQSSYSEINHSLRSNRSLWEMPTCQHTNINSTLAMMGKQYTQKWRVIYKSVINSHGPSPKWKIHLSKCSIYPFPSGLTVLFNLQDYVAFHLFPKDYCSL